MNKYTLLEAMCLDMAKTIGTDGLLAIAQDRMIKQLEHRDINNIKRLAAVVGTIGTLNCGIEGHLKDCACVLRYTGILAKEQND